MFKVMSQRDVIKMVERKGFVLVRNSDHKVYELGTVTILIPHSKTISSGLVHQIDKTLKSLKKAA